jgi:hypothetical protein
MSRVKSVPACRKGVTEMELRREADRAVLFGAVLAARRPEVKLKPQLVEAVQELLPGVRDYLKGANTDEAAFALEYARACGAENFLEQKRSSF